MEVNCYFLHFMILINLVFCFHIICMQKKNFLEEQLVVGNGHFCSMGSPFFSNNHDCENISRPLFNWFSSHKVYTYRHRWYLWLYHYHPSSTPLSSSSWSWCTFRWCDIARKWVRKSWLTSRSKTIHLPAMNRRTYWAQKTLDQQW